jgi:hypothetical protein
MNRTSVVSILFATSMYAASIYAAPLDRIQFIKISPQDSSAVVRGFDNKMSVVKPGDTVADNTTIKEIVPGRIILEEKTSSGIETIIVRMDKGRSRIERLRKLPETNQPILAPANQKK